MMCNINSFLPEAEARAFCDAVPVISSAIINSIIDFNTN